jgi:hypothetical protein
VESRVKDSEPLTLEIMKKMYEEALNSYAEYKKSVTYAYANQNPPQELNQKGEKIFHIQSADIDACNKPHIRMNVSMKNIICLGLLK